VNVDNPLVHTVAVRSSSIKKPSKCSNHLTHFSNVTPESAKSSTNKTLFPRLGVVYANEFPNTICPCSSLAPSP
jgi:hypothetical protein